MRLKIEAIPSRNGPGEEIAIYADEDALYELVEALQGARHLPVGMFYKSIGNNHIHVFRTAPVVDE